MQGPFHKGEIEIQERAGVRAIANRIGDVILDRIPTNAVPFLQAQPFVLLGAAADDGMVWATVLAAAPGFLQPSDDESRIQVRSGLLVNDPLAAALTIDRAVGLLAIESQTRRRIRVNGCITDYQDNCLTIDVAESYPNCPKYIQSRAYEITTDRRPGNAQAFDALDDRHRALIADADTFYIASMHAERGADVSHRGGLPGFVSADHPTRIRWPDYSGNHMFQTLGNLHVDPRAGLLFIDTDSGMLLHLSGRVSIDWNETRVKALTGAQRIIDFDIDRIVERPASFPYSARLIEYSPYNPATTSDG